MTPVELLAQARRSGEQVAAYGLLGNSAASGEGWVSGSSDEVREQVAAALSGADLAEHLDVGLGLAKTGVVRAVSVAGGNTVLFALTILAKGGEARNQKRHVFWMFPTRPGAADGLGSSVRAWIDSERGTGRIPPEQQPSPEQLLRSILETLNDVGTAGGSPTHLVVKVPLPMESRLVCAHAGVGFTRAEGWQFTVPCGAHAVPDAQGILGSRRVAVVAEGPRDNWVVDLNTTLGKREPSAAQVLAHIGHASEALTVSDGRGGPWTKAIRLPHSLRPLETVPLDGMGEWLAHKRKGGVGYSRMVVGEFQRFGELGVERSAALLAEASLTPDSLLQELETAAVEKSLAAAAQWQKELKS